MFRLCRRRRCCRNLPYGCHVATLEKRQQIFTELSNTLAAMPRPEARRFGNLVA